MQKFVLFLACVIGSVVAFVPTSSRAGRVAPVMAAERSKALPFLLRPAKLDGTLAGDVGFDPLGLSSIDEVGVDLYWLREAELKHGRIAMLAFLGTVATDAGFVVPGLPTSPNQVANFWTLFDRNPGPIFAATAIIGVLEIFSWVAIYEGRKSGDRAPGDFSFNPLKFGQSEASKKDLALKEVSNGRLAMWAMAGILLQGTTTGAGAFENLFS